MWADKATSGFGVWILMFYNSELSCLNVLTWGVFGCLEYSRYMCHWFQTMASDVDCPPLALPTLFYRGISGTSRHLWSEGKGPRAKCGTWHVGLNSTLSDHKVHTAGKRSTTEIQLLKFAKGYGIQQDNQVLSCHTCQVLGTEVLSFILLWLHLWYGLGILKVLHDFKRVAEIVAHFLGGRGKE